MWGNVLFLNTHQQPMLQNVAEISNKMSGDEPLKLILYQAWELLTLET